MGESLDVMGILREVWEREGCVNVLKFFRRLLGDDPSYALFVHDEMILFGKIMFRPREGCSPFHHEMMIGTLISLIPGVVVLKSGRCLDSGRHSPFDGLMERSPDGNEFRLRPFQSAGGGQVIIDRRNADRSFSWEEGSGMTGNGMRLQVGPERWQEMFSWLDHWLPAAESSS